MPSGSSQMIQGYKGWRWFKYLLGSKAPVVWSEGSNQDNHDRNSRPMAASWKCGFPRLPNYKIRQANSKYSSLIVLDETPAVLEVINIKVFLLSSQETRSAKPSQNRMSWHNWVGVSFFDLFNNTFVHLRLICLIATCVTGLLHTIDYVRKCL